MSDSARKSRHCRDESDPLLAFYSYNIAATSSDPISKSVRNSGRMEDLSMSVRQSLSNYNNTHNSNANDYDDPHAAAAATVWMRPSYSSTSGEEDYDHQEYVIMAHMAEQQFHQQKQEQQQQQQQMPYSQQPQHYQQQHPFHQKQRPPLASPPKVSTKKTSKSKHRQQQQQQRRHPSPPQLPPQAHASPYYYSPTPQDQPERVPLKDSEDAFGKHHHLHVNNYSSCSDYDSGREDHHHPNNNNPPKPPPQVHKVAFSKPREKKKKGYRIHRVSYTAQNHVQVLFRMYGSAFPQVLPFCLVNFVWTLFVIYLKNVTDNDRWSIDLTFHSSVGHSFMGLLVSFLIVSRSKISYERFMQHRIHLATTYRACRELIQFATVYSMMNASPQAQQWRQDVSYRTILLLRVTMDALLWSSTEREQWEEEYFTDHHHPKEEEEGDANDNPTKVGPDGISEHFFQFRSLTHGRRSMIDEHFRAPMSMAHVLRQVIMQHSQPQYLGATLAVNEYRDLLNFVTIFLEAFHGFRVLIFTPYPFPLVQMTRAFLFFWVYSLPLVLLKDYRVWSSLIIVVVVTMGFIGIEYVSMALDDPFGDDTNDVDEHGMALLVYEDIYLAIYRTDGPAAAIALRQRILERYKQGRGLDCYRNDLKEDDFWEQMYQQRHTNPQNAQQQQPPPPAPATPPTSMAESTEGTDPEDPFPATTADSPKDQPP